MFPSWFVGVAFAAIAIGALVPAAVMSIAAANLFTRNIYKEYLRPQASHADEARTAKIVSLLVKGGALVIIVTLPTKYAIELQLLGGVWILQTLPAIVIGLYTRWLHPWALVAGWAVGMTVGTLMARVAGLRADVSAGDLRDDDQRVHGDLRAGREPRRDARADGRCCGGAAKVDDDADETQPADYDELAEDTVYPQPGAGAPAPARARHGVAPAATLARMTTSAGLLLFRERDDGVLEVLLGHMGGPFWARKDAGAWSIPKGELDPGEEPLAGALREFAEELGHAPPDGPVIELGEIRQKARQAGDRVRRRGRLRPGGDRAGHVRDAVAAALGPRQAFPEVDRVAWFDLPDRGGEDRARAGRAARAPGGGARRAEGAERKPCGQPFGPSPLRRRTEGA